MYVCGAGLFYVCCNDCVGVCRNVCCLAAVVKDGGVLSLGLLKYIACLRGVMDVVLFLYCDAWSYRCSGMESMRVS